MDKITQIWDDFIRYITDYDNLWRIGLAVAVFVFAFAMKQFFVKIILKILKKFVGKTKNKIDDQIIDVIKSPVGMIILVAGAYFALMILKLPQAVDETLGKVVLALIDIALFWTIYRAADRATQFLKKYSQKNDSKLDDMLVGFIRNAAKAVVIAIGCVTVIQIWQKDIAGIIAGLGLGGLAFALAAQDTVGNLFGGLTIMMDKPFKIGDLIEINDVKGIVEEMSFRSTKMRTFERQIVTIPNSTLSNSMITNWSRRDKIRNAFKLGVTYSSTSEQIKKCCEKITGMLKSRKDLEPENVIVKFEGFNDSSLDIFILYYVKTINWIEFLNAKEEINLEIMNILEQMNIEVAFPSTSVYIEKQ